MAESFGRLTDRILGDMCFWSWSAAVKVSRGTKVGFYGRSVSMQAIVKLFSPVAVSAFWCSISPASPLDDVVVDDQGNLSRIAVHRCRRDCCRRPGLTTCRPVRRICKCAPGHT